MNAVVQNEIINQRIYLLDDKQNKDMQICRYMDFDYFLNILEGHYYVNRRNNFLDAREKGEIPYLNRCCLHIVGDNATEIDDESLKAQMAKKDEIVRFVENSKNLLTSCWTIDNGENYLMWKAYTSRCGVCIHTTIDSLMSKIHTYALGYIPVCLKMYYNGVNTHAGVTQAIMSKDKYYASENEIRFYFIPCDESIKPNSQSIGIDETDKLIKRAINEESCKVCNIKEKNKSDHVTFDIDPSFIHSVTLSPFWNSSSIHEVRKLLTGQYPQILDRLPNMVERSKIEFGYDCESNKIRGTKKL